MPDPNHQTDPTTPEAPAGLGRGVLEAATKGDLEAFEQVVRTHQGGIRAYLAARLSQRSEAEDLAQEVFVTAFRRIDAYSPDRPIGPWLRGIAHNLLRNHLRKFRALPIGGNDELQSMLDARIDARLADEREPALVGTLHECLDELDGPAREVVEARYLRGEAVAEIQKRTGRGYSALTMQLHRIRMVLSQCIQRKLDGAGAN